MISRPSVQLCRPPKQTKNQKIHQVTANHVRTLDFKNKYLDNDDPLSFIIEYTVLVSIVCTTQCYKPRPSNWCSDSACY